MINIAEKLKNAPKGTKLYSLVHGEVELLSLLEEEEIYTIFVESTTQKKDIYMTTTESSFTILVNASYFHP